MKNVFKADFVLVYQMGKVGSTSLVKSLPQAMHAHSLYWNNPCSVRNELDLTFVERIKMKLIYFIIRGCIKLRREVKIISMVRDPLERDISMFFQDLPYWLVSYQKDNPHFEKTNTKDYLMKVFEEGFDFSYCENWFDTELKKFSGIDIYKYPFEPNKGFTILNKGKFKVLVVNFEMLKEKPDETELIISEFVNTPCELVSENNSNKKWYSSVYSNFKNEYKAELRKSNKYKNHKIKSHFYG